MLESVLLTENGCDRATAYHMSSKVIRHRDGLFVSWLDDDFRAVFARIHPETYAVEQSTLLHQGMDNHCGAALTVDINGRVHAMCGAHATGGFVYRWSDTPCDADSWSLPASVGRSATYPSLIDIGDGSLLLSHRYVDAHGCWGTNMQFCRPNEHFDWPYMLVRAPSPLYHFPTASLARGADGRIHILVEFYKTYPSDAHPPHSMAVTHLYSDNKGGSWHHDDGRELNMNPVGIEDCAFVQHEPAGDLRPGNIVVLPDGRAVCGISNLRTGNACLFVRDGDADWRSLDLTDAANRLKPGHMVNSQLRLAVDEAGEIVVATTLASDIKWSSSSNQIACFWVSPERWEVSRSELVAKVDPERANWLAAIEHGHIGTASDPLVLLFTDGNTGQGCANDTVCQVRAVRLD